MQNFKNTLVQVFSSELNPDILKNILSEIIALTANALVTDRAKFFNAGMDEFVPKPVEKEVLLRAIHSFLIE